MDTCETNLKICLFEQLAQMGKSLGHANRLMILDILAQAPTQVEILSKKLGLSVANVSKHLQQLKQAGLVVNEVNGALRIYRLSDPAIVPLIQAMRQVAENQITEVSTILYEKLDPRAPLMPFNPKELKKALKADQVILLDVRPQDEYQARADVPWRIRLPGRGDAGPAGDPGSNPGLMHGAVAQNAIRPQTRIEQVETQLRRDLDTDVLDLAGLDPDHRCFLTQGIDQASSCCHLIGSGTGRTHCSDPAPGCRRPSPGRTGC